MLPTRDPLQDKRHTQTESEGLEKNIPSNENQRPATKATSSSTALNQDRRSNKEFPRQKKSKRTHLQQTSSERDAKGTAGRKGRKRERERRTKVQKIGNE